MITEPKLKELAARYEYEIGDVSDVCDVNLERDIVKNNVTPGQVILNETIHPFKTNVTNVTNVTTSPRSIMFSFPVDDVGSLRELDEPREGICAVCMQRRVLYWCVVMRDGSWGDLCEDCGRALMKRLRGSDGGEHASPPRKAPEGQERGVDRRGEACPS